MTARVVPLDSPEAEDGPRDGMVEEPPVKLARLAQLMEAGRCGSVRQRHAKRDEILIALTVRLDRPQRRG
jgi:hypothetical protein